jgi:hypothetical protein
MDTQQITLRSSMPGAPSEPNPDGGAAQALAECRRMVDAADAAIDQAYSGDAETFLAANKQDGGQ